MRYKAPTVVSINSGSHHLLGFEANHKMEKLFEFQKKRQDRNVHDIWSDVPTVNSLFCGLMYI